jgi:hypothetical protein
MGIDDSEKQLLVFSVDVAGGMLHPNNGQYLPDKIVSQASTP